MIGELRAMPLDERMMTVLLIGAVIGLLLGVLMARESQRRQPVRGGLLAQLFHYLGSAAYSALIPAILVAILAEMPILRVMATGLSFGVTAWLSLFLYGLFESSAPPLEEKVVIELD